MPRHINLDELTLNSIGHLHNGLEGDDGPGFWEATVGDEVVNVTFRGQLPVPLYVRCLLEWLDSLKAYTHLNCSPCRQACLNFHLTGPECDAAPVLLINVLQQIRADKPQTSQMRLELDKSCIPILLERLDDQFTIDACRGGSSSSITVFDKPRADNSDATVHIPCSSCAPSTQFVELATDHPDSSARLEPINKLAERHNLPGRLAPGFPWDEFDPGDDIDQLIACVVTRERALQQDDACDRYIEDPPPPAYERAPSYSPPPAYDAPSRGSHIARLKEARDSSITRRQGY